jgi:hypothetical protein
VVKKAKKPGPEPFHEQAVINMPRCGRIQPHNSPWVDDIGFFVLGLLENNVNRRSFVMSLFGGVAAAGVAGSAFAKSASAGAAIAPAMPAAGEIDAPLKAALDQTDADFSQVVVRERVVRRPARTVVVRRPPVVRRTVVVRRPRRVVRRRVIVR